MFAGGLLLGFGTLSLLAYNGLLLGTLAGLTIQSGTFSVFVRYIVPHGLLELSCIAIAGVAGLRLARALIEPGVLPRAQALRAEARGAVRDGARAPRRGWCSRASSRGSSPRARCRSGSRSPSALAARGAVLDASCSPAGAPEDVPRAREPAHRRMRAFALR